MNFMFQNNNNDESTINVAVEGTESAGKSTVIALFQRALNEKGTEGVNFLEQNLIKEEQLFRYGGRGMIRPAEKIMQQKLKAGVLVLDATNQELAVREQVRISQFKTLCDRMHWPLLCLVNKQDLKKKVKNTQEILTELKLNFNGARGQVRECSALTGEGVKEGLDWLLDVLENDRREREEWNAKVAARRVEAEAERAKKAAEQAANTVTVSETQVKQAPAQQQQQDNKKVSWFKKTISKKSAAVKPAAKLKQVEDDESGNQKKKKQQDSPNSLLRRVAQAIF